MGDEHRIQIRVDDVGWARAQRAMTENGLLSVSKLCEMLLNREYARLAIDSEKAEAMTVTDAEAEHRIQIRVKEAKWALAQQVAAANGFDTVSDLCRHLLEKEFERCRNGGKTLAQTARAKRKGKKKSSGRK